MIEGHISRCKSATNVSTSLRAAKLLRMANEAHRVAINWCYLGIDADGPPPHLPQTYLREASSQTQQQIKRAGVRLAYLLNEALK
jgi:hypothetical protein